MAAILSPDMSTCLLLSDLNTTVIEYYPILLYSLLFEQSRVYWKCPSVFSFTALIFDTKIFGVELKLSWFKF